jgi:hypothetical protein
MPTVPPRPGKTLTLAVPPGVMRSDGMRNLGAEDIPFCEDVAAS